MTSLANELLTKDEAAQLASVSHDIVAAMTTLRVTVDNWLRAKGIEADDRELMQDAITDQIIEGSRRGARR